MAQQVVTKQKIRQLSGSQTFDRGKVYFDEGRVEDLSVTESTASATIAGSGSYEVELYLAAAGLVGGCTCPQGAGGRFCKHCVATALAWLDQAGSLVLPDPPERISDERLRAFLAGQDPGWLVEELLCAARMHPMVRVRLEVTAGGDMHDVLDAGALRHRLSHAIRVACLSSYDDVDERFAGAKAVLREVADLVDAGFAHVAVELAEFALDLPALRDGAADRLTEQVDDLAYAVWRVHRAACADYHPDPVALADRLVDRTLARGVPHDAVPDYVLALGTEGLARYGDRLDQAWRELDADGGASDANASPTARAVRRMRNRLAEQRGGADALIALLPADAPAQDVLRVVRALIAEERLTEAAGRVREALERLSGNAELRELGAECLVRTGDRRGAVELLWPGFIGAPTLRRYQLLAGAAGEHWARWRGRALTLLREHAAEPGRQDEFGTLAKILLWEGDVDGAWRVVQDHEVGGETLLDVARERGLGHPDDVVPVFVGVAEQEIAGKQKRAYSRAAQLLAEARSLVERNGGHAGFRRELAALRTRHKTKSALQKELDQAGLP